MARKFSVAVMISIDDPDHSVVKQSMFDELVSRLKREMARGRDSGAFVQPGVTLEMLAFYREHPEWN
jgi:hypothetical protein